MPVGVLTLHRFNGEEIYNVSEAVIRYFVGEDGVCVDFQVKTDQEPVQTLPDTQELQGWPNGEWQLFMPEFDPDDLVGRVFSIPQGYDEQDEEYRTNFYYVEHEPIDDNQITVLGREGERFRVRLTGAVPDVNYYDGSKPPTRVEVEARFSLTKSEEEIEPVG
jgi:hypothetical protein